MTRHAWVIGCVAFVVLVAGCGDDDGMTPDAGGGSGGTGGDGALTWEQYVQGSIDGHCTQTIECPPQSDDALGMRAVLRTFERCQAHFSSVDLRWIGLGRIGAQVAAGRIDFDGAAAAACFALHTPCESLSSAPAANDPCLHVLSGTIALGDDCYGHEECAAGTYCASDSDTCPGQCTAKVALGEGCEDRAACAGVAGSTACDFAAEPSVCTARTILRAAAEGAACGQVTSDTQELCAPGLWCGGPFDDQGVGVCAAPVLIGEGCDNDTLCEGLAFCDDVTDTCQDVSIADAVGAPCDMEPGIPRRMCDPLENLICVDGACAVAGDGGDGSRCVPGDLGDNSCQTGFYCDWDTDTCLPLRETGAACDSSQQCMIECDYALGECVDHTCGI